MPPLRTCDLVYGNIFYSAINPFAGAFEGATVIPKQQFALLDSDLDWGVYDKNGTNISSAAYRRGPDQNRIGQSQKIEIPSCVHIDTSGCTFIYIGPMFMHYGHFLLTSIARLWPLLKIVDRNIKLVYHGDHDIETICKHIPLAEATFRALNLTFENFFRPVEPATFSLLHIPAPSFEETNSAHRIHGELGATIGRSLERSRAPRSFPNPVIFAKTRLTAGVSRIVNEAEIVDRLAQRGVEIIYPESLSLAEQVDVFEKAPALVSYAGSALHTSILASRPARIVGLYFDATAGSSQILIDFLKNNDSSYFYPSGSAKPSDSPSFAIDFRIDDPHRVADELLRQIDAKASWKAHLRKLVGRKSLQQELAYPGVQSLWP